MGELFTFVLIRNTSFVKNLVYCKSSQIRYFWEEVAENRSLSKNINIEKVNTSVATRIILIFFNHIFISSFVTEKKKVMQNNNNKKIISLLTTYVGCG